MPVLVTGALGQIGSRAALALSRSDAVIGLDLALPLGAPALPCAAWIACDLTAPLPPEARAALAGCTRVLHVAGSREDRAFDAAHAWEATRINAVGTAHLLAALPPSVEHVVLVSSLSVYGRPERVPIPETAAVAPLSAYGASKANAERIAGMWSSSRGAGLTIARLAQVYGPGTDPRNGICRMLDAAGRKEAVRIRCRPDLQRDYLHVDDAARLLAALVERAPGGAVNVGSGRGTSITALASCIAAARGAPDPVEEPFAGDGGYDLVLDTSRLATLGCRARIPIDEGIGREARRLAGAGT